VETADGPLMKTPRAIVRRLVGTPMRTTAI
jgi:hypothetical protein